MPRTNRPDIATPTLATRCRAINAAIREGCIVQANIRGIMYPLISIKSEVEGVSLLFRSEEGLALLKVAPDAILEFTVLVPTAQEASR